MYLPATILLTLAFGLSAIYFSLKEDKAKKKLLEREEKQRQRLYEISILKEIQDRIGYELDIEKVADVITGSLKNLFSYSTVSSLILKDDKLIFKTNAEEEISPAYIEKVRNSMKASLGALLNSPLPEKIEEILIGSLLNDQISRLPSSFFQIPLVVNDNVLGLINISSTKPGLYKEDQMTILYKITGQASSALYKLEKVLKTEKGKLMSLIGSLADGVFMVGSQNQIVIINNAAKEILGFKKEEKITFSEILKILGGKYNLALEINEAIGRNKISEETEVRIGPKTVQIFITPVFDSENKAFGTAVLLQDITLEENLSELKETFTNMIVHELRAPLTAIRGASRLLSDAEEKLNGPEKEKLLSIIHEQSKFLLDEVSSVLDAAKIEAGKFTIQKQETDLGDLIDEKVKLFSPQAQEKGVEIATEAANDLPKALIDPVRIGQVLNNLLINSLKFTPKGGKITVRATHGTALPTTDLQLYRSTDLLSDDIIVSVSDNGVGIPKEKQKDLFSKFAQATSFPTPEHGTGLGLYIVKGIVEAHGGKVSLDSEPGRGTTISFTLPATISAHLTESATPLPNHFSTL